MARNKKLHSLEDLLLHEVRDLYYAEKQIAKRLPRMAKAANEPRLRKAFESHHAETLDHVARLEKVFEELGATAKGERCEAMDGILAEASDLFDMDIDPEVLDAALISAAQRVEHYEIAGYGCARAFAKRLGLDEVARLLDETIREEGAADKTLTRIAESGVNAAAKAGAGR